MFEFSWWVKLASADGGNSWYMALGLIHVVLFLIIGIVYGAYSAYGRVTEDSFMWDAKEDDNFIVFLYLCVTFFSAFVWPLIYISIVVYINYLILDKLILPAIRKYKFKVKNDFKWKNETLEIIDE